MILFLDFDGVLHPFPMRPSDTHFSAIAPLWKVLETHPDMSVVITSTWRERHTFSQLLGILATHGGERFTARFIGATPILESENDYVPGIRQREIESWLVDNDAVHARHIVLDDIEEYFDSSCSNLYLVDGVTGLTGKDADLIALWMASLE